MPAPKPVILALVAALALAPGCAGDDEEEVRDALERYATAVAGKDYQTICDDIFAPELVEQVRRVNLPCEVALRTGFEEVERPRIRVLSVKIDGDTAEARVRSTAANQEPSEDVVRLVKVDGDWRVASLAS
jgi:hypothetical protein